MSDKEWDGLPGWNSVEGSEISKRLFEILRPKNSLYDLVLLGVISSLVILPKELTNVIMIPLSEVPLHLHGKSRLVKIISKLRLEYGV